MRQAVDVLLKISEAVVVMIFVAIGRVVGVQTQLTFPRIGHTVLVSIETSRADNRWIHVSAAYFVLRVNDLAGFVDDTLYQSLIDYVTHQRTTTFLEA